MMGEHGVPGMHEHGVPRMGEHGVLIKKGDQRVPRIGEHIVPLIISADWCWRAPAVARAVIAIS